MQNIVKAAEVVASWMALSLLATAACMVIAFSLLIFGVEWQATTGHPLFWILFVGAQLLALAFGLLVPMAKHMEE